VRESRLKVAFPETHRSAVAAAGSADPEERSRAWNALIEAYGPPVERHLRTRWGLREEDAEDVAQGFFTAMLEGTTLARFDPVKGRFRSYLLACLDAFAANERRSERRLKRGGGALLVPLEGGGEDGEPLQIPDGRSLEEEFQKEFARSLFTRGVLALGERCRGTPKEIRFAIFEKYDLEPEDGVSYAQLAQELGIPQTQVTNHLAWARRAFREEVLLKLREITGSEEEFQAEARALLGGTP
jgi:RNA polymerase sigma factor (sigma-70 family)